MKWKLAKSVVYILLMIVGSTSSNSDELSEMLSEQLATTVLAADETQDDVRRFAAARIPAVPEYQTAGEWQVFADATRKATLDNVVFRGSAAAWRDAWTRVERLETIEGGPGYSIQKLRIEVLPDMWVPGLLYVPTTVNGKVPVFVNVNGHDRSGTAADYKQSRCIHMARNGIIALNLEWFGMGQLNIPGFSHGRMNQLDLCGASGLAPFYLAMSRSIDFLLSLENADETRVGVAGLSGGGWQTILISSLDTRVTLCNPVAGYSSFRTRIDHFSDLGDSEQTPVDLGITADYAHLTALLAPRAALLTYNEKDDCCFASGHALQPLLQAASPVYNLTGHADRLRTHVNSDPGNHNFLLDNRQALYRMIRDQWFAGDDSAFPGTELPLEKELKTRAELDVVLPMSNLNFQTLALSLAKEFPASKRSSNESTDRETWRREFLESLQKTVRPRNEVVKAEEISRRTLDGVNVAQWKLIVGDWSVPGTEFSRGEPARTAVLICDEGRKATAARVASLLDDGFRVVALDPFGFGESAIAERGYLWALMVSTTGERPLGVQTGQVLSVAEWVKQRNNTKGVTLVADGPRTSVIGVIAAAMRQDLVTQFEEHQPMESLKTVLQANYSFEQAPELFCAGLLEITDLPQLREFLKR